MSYTTTTTRSARCIPIFFYFLLVENECFCFLSNYEISNISYQTSIRCKEAQKGAGQIQWNFIIFSCWSVCNADCTQNDCSKRIQLKMIHIHFELRKDESAIGKHKKMRILYHIQNSFHYFSEHFVWC